jgi:hypothetical protein
MMMIAVTKPAKNFLMGDPFHDPLVQVFEQRRRSIHKARRPYGNLVEKPTGGPYFRPKHSITPDPKTASRDPATAHPGVCLVAADAFVGEDAPEAFLVRSAQIRDRTNRDTL